MKNSSKIDAAGRVVIPKAFRERYGLSTDRKVRIVALPDGVAIIPEKSNRRIIRKGGIVAIDTGVENAALDLFDVTTVREEHLTTKER
jgi:AbrB family looped-hinge helix DNA binding protein